VRERNEGGTSCRFPGEKGWKKGALLDDYTCGAYGILFIMTTEKKVPIYHSLATRARVKKYFHFTRVIAAGGKELSEMGGVLHFLLDERK